MIKLKPTLGAVRLPRSPSQHPTDGQDSTWPIWWQEKFYKHELLYISEFRSQRRVQKSMLRMKLQLTVEHKIFWGL